MSCQYLSTESDEEHGDRAGVEETTEEVRWCKSCNAAETESCAKHQQKIVVQTQKLVCSCASFTCYAIGRYGLPVPTFEKEIRPIGDQYRRDMRALDIKRSAS